MSKILIKLLKGKLKKRNKQKLVKYRALKLPKLPESLCLIGCFNYLLKFNCLNKLSTMLLTI